MILQLCIQQVESSTKISIWPLIGSTSKSWWMQREISADFFRWGKVGTLRFRCSKVYCKFTTLMDIECWYWMILDMCWAFLKLLVHTFSLLLSYFLSTCRGRRIQGNSSIDATKRLQHPCWFNTILIWCVLFLSGVSKTSLLSSKPIAPLPTSEQWGNLLPQDPKKSNKSFGSFGRIDHSLFPSPAKPSFSGLVLL